MMASCRPAAREAGAPAKEVVADKRKATPPTKQKLASPPTRKLPPPEYAAKLPSAPLTELNRDYKSVKDRYTRLYISADFCKVVAAWAQVWPSAHALHRQICICMHAGCVACPKHPPACCHLCASPALLWPQRQQCCVEFLNKVSFLLPHYCCVKLLNKVPFLLPVLQMQQSGTRQHAGDFDRLNRSFALSHLLAGVHSA